MKRAFKFTARRAKKFTKHAVDIVAYGENIPEANVVHVSVEEGHFEEFFDEKSWFIYYIYEGNGTFVLDNKKIKVKATDLVTIPPKTPIHYFGKMKMVLTVSPAFDEKNQHHVRFVDKSESPYFKQLEKQV